MKESQIEIQAIQAKLQALQMGRTAMHQPIDSLQTNIASAPLEDTASRSNGASDWAAIDAVSSRDFSRPDRSHERSTSFRKAIDPQRLSTRETNDLLRQLNLPETATPPVDSVLAKLEAQIDQIHELAAAQEVALLELKNLAEAVDRLDPYKENDLPTCEFLAAAVPLVERDRDGVFVVSTRPIDVFRAEREAVSIAQTLRSRASKPPASRRYRRNVTLWDLLKGWLDQPDRRPARRPAPTITIVDAAIWIVGATVVRVGLDLLLSSFPHLWLPVAGLIVLPAAIAIYRTTFTPETGFIWGYRLFLVMIGLLLGGRL